MVISGRKKKFLVTNRGMLAHLRYLKSHVTAMDFYLQTNMLWNMDLSIEVLNIDFGQGAAKISEVKVGVGKKYLLTQPTLCTGVRTWLIGRYFFRTPN